MVGHQAIGPNLGLRLARPLAQQIKIQAVVVIAKKHRLSAIAALGDMMRVVWNHKTGKTSHGYGVSDCGAKNYILSPDFGISYCPRISKNYILSPDLVSKTFIFH